MKLNEKYVVTEDINRFWHYHLSDKKTTAIALCGIRTMICGAPFSTWGFKSHLTETYCKECLEIAQKSMKLIEMAKDVYRATI